MSPKAILKLQASDMFLLLNYGDTARMSLYLESGCRGDSGWGINSFRKTCVWIESPAMSQMVRQQTWGGPGSQPTQAPRQTQCGRAQRFCDLETRSRQGHRSSTPAFTCIREKRKLVCTRTLGRERSRQQYSGWPGGGNTPGARQLMDGDTKCDPTCRGLVFSREEEGHADTCHNVGEPGEPAKWKTICCTISFLRDIQNRQGGGVREQARGCQGLRGGGAG